MEGARMVQKNSAKIAVSLVGNSASGRINGRASRSVIFAVPSFVAAPDDKANDSRAALANTLDQTLNQTLNQRLGQKIAQIENRRELLEDEVKEIRVPLGIAEIDAALDPYFQKNALNSPDGAPSSNADNIANDIPSDILRDIPGDIPGGIIANALHEVRVETGLGAASGAGFALALGLTIAQGITQTIAKGSNKTHIKTASNIHAANQTPPPLPQLPIFWISDPFTRMEYGDFYGPGLSIFGLTAQNLIRIHAKHSGEALWAAGEIAATKGAAGCCLLEVRGNPQEIDLTSSRRLMLRARSSGTPVIVLRQSGRQEASAAATRWCVTPTRSTQAINHRQNNLPFLGNPAFTVSLEKCRAGRNGQWTLEWNPYEHCLTLAKPRTIIDAGNSHRSPLSGCPPAETFNRSDSPSALGQCMAAERAS